MEMIKDRLAKLRQGLVNLEVDSILISQPSNRFYLSGFTGSAGYLLITQREAILATDSRYFEQVKQQSPDYVLFEIKGRNEEWLPRLFERHSLRRLGFESTDITFAFCKEISTILGQKLAGIELVPLENTVEKLRGIKEPEELTFIQHSAEIGDLAFESVSTRIKPGMTELQVAWELEKHMREHGSQSMPFEVIVGAGPNAALPHHGPADYPITAGVPIVIDMGACFKGYSSDLTRTICLGKPDETFVKIYDIVRRAQEAAIEGIHAGMNGVQADALSRNIINSAGYGDMFGHGLGHGVGLSVHDLTPRLSYLAPLDEIVDGMVFSIEPGIYLPGWGGVRIEDLAVMEAGKVKLLSHARKWHEK
jgi:Xaa-Pro aminopeptidase